MGLTGSDACHMMLTKIAREKRLPFGTEEPNKETRQALEAVEQRKGFITLKIPMIFLSNWAYEC